MSYKEPIEDPKYYRSLDGLRAFCFLVVFLFHCNIYGFQVGWAGVNVFFVISGFLISEILINTKQHQAYFKTFYMRRILRIIPIYFLVVLGLTLFFFLLKKTLPNDLFYNFTYTQNMLWIFTHYSSDLQPYLAHTWSLAVEEQFYLLWPLLIWLIPEKHFSKLCISTILLGIIFRTFSVLYINNKFVPSILLFSQVDSLALGALLACYKVNIIKNKIYYFFVRYSILTGLFGIILVLIYISIKTKINIVSAYNLLKTPEGYITNPFTVQLFFFIGLFSLGLIYKCYNYRSTLFHKVLSLKFLNHLGKISYGLYLYHWPIIIILKKAFPNLFGGLSFVILTFTITYFVAVTSYYTIEKFFSKLKSKFRYNDFQTQNNSYSKNQ